MAGQQGQQALLVDLMFEPDAETGRHGGDDLAKQTQIDAARAKWQAAAGKYAVPSQVFEDDQVTPEALHKAALTFDKLGDAAQAQKIRQQLKQRYPKWQPKQ